MLADSITNPTFICFKETSSYWSVQFFLSFSLVTIRVVNLPERTETGFITGWDQIVRAVHNCKYYGRLLLLLLLF